MFVLGLKAGKKMGKLIDKKQDFILIGEKEYLKQLEEAHTKRNLKKFIQVVLLGGGALALPGISAISLSAALGLGFFAAADPEPISKAAMIIAVAAILSVTAAILIYKITKLYINRADFVKINIRTPFFTTEMEARLVKF